MVRRFWKQEEAPSPGALSPEDLKCEEHFASTHARKAEVRYVVRLPIIAPLLDLYDTRHTALRAWKHMESRFARDASLCEQYSDFMRHYAELGHMTRAASATEPTVKRVYLPHHGVMRESSTTTKLRVVFNDSTTVPSGASLNQHLMIGPNLLPVLADVLLRLRRHRFVFATDIEKMYQQIEVHQLDRDLQRILEALLTRKSPNSN